jgi:hypothetical protein
MGFAARYVRLAMLMTATGALLAASSAAVAMDGVAPPADAVVPAGTHVRFHLNQPLSSATNRTGEPFTFTLLDPIAAGPSLVIPAGAQGNGTLVMSGHAGSQGHEGDLTLRIDTVDAGGDMRLAFDDQHFEFNGHNRKVASSILGFVPLVGTAAMFIRGNEAAIDAETPIVTVLMKPAAIRNVDSLASPSPMPSPSSSAVPSPAPSPTP